MKQNKSEHIRFEILRILLNTSTYGYQLFLFLSERGLVKDVSECYKNIRSLKDAGLIRDVEFASIPGLSVEDTINQNSSKKMLKITQEGIQAYYEWIYNSMLVFLDFVEQIRRTSISVEIKSYFVERGIQYDSIANKSILFSFQNMPLRWQEGIIEKLLLPLAKGNAIYLQTTTELSKDLMQLLSSKTPHVTILTDVLRLRPDSIDFIFDFNAPSLEPMEEVMVQWNTLLKDGGQLISFIPKAPITSSLPLSIAEDSEFDGSNPQQIGWKEPLAALDMVNLFIEEIPANLRKMYAKRLLPFSDISKFPSQIEFPIIYAAIRRTFPNVAPYIGKNHFNFLLAIKNTQDFQKQSRMVEYSFSS